MKRSWFVVKGRGPSLRMAGDFSILPPVSVSPTSVTVIPESARPPQTSASISFTARYRSQSFTSLYKANVPACISQCSIAYHEPYLRLIEKLLPVMPDPSLDSFFFWNSGSEAVEGSLKMARIYTGRKGIITMQGLP